MDTLNPEQAKHAGLSQEDEEPHTPPKGQAGDTPDEVVDDLANDKADTANDVKESGDTGLQLSGGGHER